MRYLYILIILCVTIIQLKTINNIIFNYIHIITFQNLYTMTTYTHIHIIQYYKGYIEVNIKNIIIPHWYFYIYI